MRPLPYGSGKEGLSVTLLIQLAGFNEAAPLRKRKVDTTWADTAWTFELQ